jgi:hypothetical protein
MTTGLHVGPRLRISKSIRPTYSFVTCTAATLQLLLQSSGAPFQIRVLENGSTFIIRYRNRHPLGLYKEVPTTAHISSNPCSSDTLSTYNAFLLSLSRPTQLSRDIPADAGHLCSHAAIFRSVIKGNPSLYHFIYHFFNVL